MAAASRGARPGWYLAGSYPSRHSVQTSEPAEYPGGVVLTVPSRPPMATASMFGFLATSSGVLLPRSGMAVSAAPSGMMMTYFMAHQ